MSDSVWPHRWQPTRLLHPWDSPGKNTGVGCHFLLHSGYINLHPQQQRKRGPFFHCLWRKPSTDSQVQPLFLKLVEHGPWVGSVQPAFNSTAGRQVRGPHLCSWSPDTAYGRSSSWEEGGLVYSWPDLLLHSLHLSTCKTFPRRSLEGDGPNPTP